MNVSLPPAWKEFVASQVKSGEYADPSEVVREALRLLRDEQEAKALEEMRVCFAGVDPHAAKGEPTRKQRALIDRLVRSHRAERRR